MRATFSNGSDRYEIEVTTTRRGMAAICSDPQYNFIDPPSYDGRHDKDGRVIVQWHNGGYAIYADNGYRVVGRGFQIDS